MASSTGRRITTLIVNVARNNRALFARVSLSGGSFFGGLCGWRCFSSFAPCPQRYTNPYLFLLLLLMHLRFHFLFLRRFAVLFFSFFNCERHFGLLLTFPSLLLHSFLDEKFIASRGFAVFGRSLREPANLRWLMDDCPNPGDVRASS